MNKWDQAQAEEMLRQGYTRRAIGAHFGMSKSAAGIRLSHVETAAASKNEKYWNRNAIEGSRALLAALLKLVEQPNAQR